MFQCGGVWVANGKFGVTWKLFQAVVKPRATLSGKCHINLDSQSKARLRKEAEEREVDVVDEVDTKVNDSDDDDDNNVVEDSKVEPAVEPVVEQVSGVAEEKHGSNDPPVEPKKKRVVKKKEPVGGD